MSTYALDTLVDKAIDNLNKRRDGLTARAHEEQRERRTILERARVVATTTSAAGAEYFKDYKFDVVIVDEAAQSSEAATLIPLMRRASHVKRIILAGDHRQLPAVAHAEDLASSARTERACSSDWCYREARETTTTATTTICARTRRRRSSCSTA